MSNTERTYIIAEAGVNHNGSIDMARQLIDAAAEAGADAVKFQTFTSKKVVSKKAPKAKYQVETTGNAESQYEMIKKLELSKKEHDTIYRYCKEKGVVFLSTPFDQDALNLLTESLNLPIIKVPSGEITNAPFLLRIAQTDKPVILSTGMSNLGEIEMALGILAFGYLKKEEKPSHLAFLQAYCSGEGQKILNDKITLLHCTTEYPAPFNEVNLRAMDTMSKAFNLPVGLSDHTVGIAVPIAAVARGASIIEKHFTLDKNLPGPDHKASLEPDELGMMVNSIRQTEQALGSSVKNPTLSELNNKAIVRKSLVAARAIKAGEVFSEKNITVKRPGKGVSPIYYWNILGKKATLSYKKDVVIKDL